MNEYPVADLEEHPQNVRRGNVGAIQDSIRSHGFLTALAVQRSTKRVVIGNHRLRAARAMGIDTVPVIWLDITDEQALRIMLADNRASDLASYDEDALLLRLRNVGDLQGTLFDDEFLETLAARVEGAPTIGSGFQGGYADAGEEQAARAQEAERIGQEMKDVVLTMRPEDYAQFMADIKALQRLWKTADKTPGIIATTMMAVHRAAQGEEGGGAYRDALRSLAPFLGAARWAVPHERLPEFDAAAVLSESVQ